MANDTTDLVPQANGELVETDQAMEQILTVFNALNTVDEDPTPRMMAAIMAEPDPAKWEKVFTAQHFKDSAGQRWVLNNPRRSPSNFDNRFGKQYLVCDAYNPRNGEASVMTISSEMAMVQLLACQARDLLPAEFEIVRKKEATRRGFFPMRLSFVRKIEAPAPATA